MKFTDGETASVFIALQRLADTGDDRDAETVRAVLDRALKSLTTARAEADELREKLQDAERIAIEWCNESGWATGHGDTLADILREMRGHSYARLATLERERRELRALADVKEDALQEISAALPVFEGRNIVEKAESTADALAKSKRENEALTGRIERARKILDSAKVEYADGAGHGGQKTWGIMTGASLTVDQVMRMGFELEIDAARDAEKEGETDLSKCPGCQGPADNGHDREDPPNVYYCTRCEHIQNGNEAELQAELARVEKAEGER